jgi:hypothetical protein
MDILTQSEINQILSSSRIKRKYDEVIDRESAYEMLGAKIEEAQKREPEQPVSTPKTSVGRPREEKSTFEKVLNSPTTRQIGRTVAQTLTRGLLGVLGIKTTATRRSTARKSSWF